MGKGSAEIAADVERQRNALKARIIHFETRVRDDLEGTEAAIRERVMQLKDAVPDAADKAAQKVKDRLPGPIQDLGNEDSPLREHPGTAMSVAAGIGLAAGLLTGGKDDDDGRQHRDADEGRKQRFRATEDAHEEPGRAQELAAKGVSTLTGFFRSELSSVLRDTWDGIWNAPGAGTGREQPAAVDGRSGVYAGSQPDDPWLAQGKPASPMGSAFDDLRRPEFERDTWEEPAATSR